MVGKCVIISHLFIDRNKCVAVEIILHAPNTIHFHHISQIHNQS